MRTKPIVIVLFLVALATALGAPRAEAQNVARPGRLTPSSSLARTARKAAFVIKTGAKAGVRLAVGLGTATAVQQAGGGPFEMGAAAYMAGLVTKRILNGPLAWRIGRALARSRADQPVRYAGQTQASFDAYYDLQRIQLSLEQYPLPLGRKLLHEAFEGGVGALAAGLTGGAFELVSPLQSVVAGRLAGGPARFMTSVFSRFPGGPQEGIATLLIGAEAFSRK
jgi:hypothetical protein